MELPYDVMVEVVLIEYGILSAVLKGMAHRHGIMRRIIAVRLGRDDLMLCVEVYCCRLRAVGIVRGAYRPVKASVCRGFYYRALPVQDVIGSHGYLVYVDPL